MNLQGYKPKKPRDPLLRHNSEDDEMRFSGLHTKADIPSKAFRMLNKIAGTENDSPNQESARDDNDGKMIKKITKLVVLSDRNLFNICFGI